MNAARKTAYSISAIAVFCFFVVPEPMVSVVGALLLQTLAFIIVAGKSTPDGLLLSGISFLLIGLLPSEHPILLGSETFEDARWVLLAIGAALCTSMLAIIIRKHY